MKRVFFNQDIGAVCIAKKFERLNRLNFNYPSNLIKDFFDATKIDCESLYCSPTFSSFFRIFRKNSIDLVKILRNIVVIISGPKSVLFQTFHIFSEWILSITILIFYGIYKRKRKILKASFFFFEDFYLRKFHLADKLCISRKWLCYFYNFLDLRVFCSEIICNRKYYFSLEKENFLNSIALLSSLFGNISFSDSLILKKASIHYHQITTFSQWSFNLQNFNLKISLGFYDGYKEFRIRNNLILISFGLFQSGQTTVKNFNRILKSLKFSIRFILFFSYHVFGLKMEKNSFLLLFCEKISDFCEMEAKRIILDTTISKFDNFWFESVHLVQKRFHKMWEYFSIKSTKLENSKFLAINNTSIEARIWSNSFLDVFRKTLPNLIHREDFSIKNEILKELIQTNEISISSYYETICKYQVFIDSWEQINNILAFTINFRLMKKGSIGSISFLKLQLRKIILMTEINKKVSLRYPIYSSKNNFSRNLNSYEIFSLKKALISDYDESFKLKKGNLDRLKENNLNYIKYVANWANESEKITRKILNIEGKHATYEKFQRTFLNIKNKKFLYALRFQDSPFSRKFKINLVNVLVKNHFFNNAMSQLLESKPKVFSENWFIVSIVYLKQRKFQSSFKILKQLYQKKGNKNQMLNKFLLDYFLNFANSFLIEFNLKESFVFILNLAQTKSISFSNFNIKNTSIIESQWNRIAKHFVNKNPDKSIIYNGWTFLENNLKNGYLSRNNFFVLRKNFHLGALYKPNLWFCFAPKYNTRKNGIQKIIFANIEPTPKVQEDFLFWKKSKKDQNALNLAKKSNLLEKKLFLVL